MIDVQFAPVRSQRRHRNEYVMGGVPVHVPVDACNTDPFVALPVIVGHDVLTGADAATIAVGSDVAVPVPPPFDAKTRTSRVEPTSLDVTVYVLAVASGIDAHAVPSGAHRSHWNAYVIGAVPTQLPVYAVNVLPSWGVTSLTVGRTAFDGATRATTVVAADVADVEPPSFVAVTARRNVEPASARSTV